MPISIFIAYGLIILLMLAAYPLAKILPIQAGWENGAIEILQMIVLIVGICMAVFYIFKTKEAVWRWFWLMIIPIWLLLIGRELSWGAAAFLPPLSIDPQTGPVYTSKQLGLRTQAHIVAALLACTSVLIFFITKQYQSLKKLWVQKNLPWGWFMLAFVAALACTTAEGHGFLAISTLNDAQSQVMEELLELCVYLSVFGAQVYVGNKNDKKK